MSDSLYVPSVSRALIDAWPVDQAGLPSRVVHCARRLHCRTLGDVRNFPPEKMLSSRGFGRRSLSALTAFLNDCAALESGRVSFRDLPDAWNRLLSHSEQETLRLRYGLDKTEGGISRNFYTLQAIANRDGVTRERVRQVLTQTLDTLRGRLADAWLRPFEDILLDVVRSRGALAEAEDFARLAHHPALGGLNPASTALLFTDAHPERWSTLGQAFILAPARRVEAFTAAVRAALRNAPMPVPAEPLGKHAALLGLGVRLRESQLCLLWRQMPDLLLFRDGSCLATESLPAFLAHLLHERGGKASVARLADELNRRLDPTCLKSQASVLRWLTTSDRFVRLRDPGTVGLRE